MLLHQSNLLNSTRWIIPFCVVAISGAYHDNVSCEWPNMSPVRVCILIYFLPIFWAYRFQCPVFCLCTISTLTANFRWIRCGHNKRLFRAKKFLIVSDSSHSATKREYTAATLHFLHFHRHFGNIWADCFPPWWVAFCLHVLVNSCVLLSNNSRKNIRYEQTTSTSYTFITPTFNNESHTGYTTVCVSPMLTIS